MPFEKADICKHPWKYKVDPFKIIGALYYVGNSDVSSYLIDTGDGLILHDTTFPQTVYLLLESIRKLGLDPGDIKYILHSHGHYDHFGGTRAIKELTGAKTYLGKEDVPILNSEKDLTWAYEYGVKFYERFDVDSKINDGDIISLGNIDIRCVSIPGHTPGSISYFFNIKEGGNTYRIGTHGGPGINTLTDEYTDRYGLSHDRRKDYMASLEKLKKEKVDIFISIHPGQNGILGKAEEAQRPKKNSFIDPEDWLENLFTLEKKALEMFKVKKGKNSL